MTFLFFSFYPLVLGMSHIRLVEESLGFCEVSESTTNNVEIIDVVAPENGTYTLQMRLTSSLLDYQTNPELRYWISWRIE